MIKKYKLTTLQNGKVIMPDDAIRSSRIFWVEFNSPIDSMVFIQMLSDKQKAGEIPVHSVRFFDDDAQVKEVKRRGKWFIDIFKRSDE